MARRTIVICLTGFLIALVSQIASAQRTWHVDDDACPGPGTGTRVDPLCSIQTAINQSSAGDTVSVAPGTYTENIDYIGKHITVISTNGPGETTIRNAVDHRVVRFSNGEGRGAVLDGFTITGLFGGIGCGPNSEPTIRPRMC